VQQRKRNIKILFFLLITISGGIGGYFLYINTLTEESSRIIAENFIYRSRSYTVFQADIRYESYVKISGEIAWTYNYTFTFSNTCYGDATKYSACGAAFTERTAIIMVKNGFVVSAVIDDSWDMIKKGSVDPMFTILTFSAAVLSCLGIIFYLLYIRLLRKRNLKEKNEQLQLNKVRLPQVFLGILIIQLVLSIGVIIRLIFLQTSFKSLLIDSVLDYVMILIEILFSSYFFFLIIGNYSKSFYVKILPLFIFLSMVLIISMEYFIPSFKFIENSFIQSFYDFFLILNYISFIILSTGLILLRKKTAFYFAAGLILVYLIPGFIVIIVENLSPDDFKTVIHSSYSQIIIRDDYFGIIFIMSLFSKCAEIMGFYLFYRGIKRNFEIKHNLNMSPSRC
jgi:hypothetical protein